VFDAMNRGLVSLALVALLHAVLAAAGAPPCPGDCDGSGHVDAMEIAEGVDAALGRPGAPPCAALESSGDAAITARDLVRAVSAAYRGCRLADCAFAAGALAADTLEPGSPVGDDIPIDHVLWVMQENRSFDHYFGKLDHDDVDGLREGMSNPDASGGSVEPFHETDLCTDDVDHSWNASHREWDGGRMDGFILTNDPGGARAMAFYDATDLPFYHALAKTFAMSDRHFCSLLGPTFPNRYFTLCATAFGKVDNDVPLFGWTQRTILQQLSAHGRTWRIYADGLAFALAFQHVRGSPNVKPLSQYFADAAAGTLPDLAIIDPAFTDVADVPTDEHPPSNIQRGQAHVAAVVNALIASPDWPASALFWTYDEHGGYFDHVAPPPACEPDSIAPELAPGDEPGAYDVLGIRVPLVVVSPWARPGFIAHRASDATSLLRFVEARFGLPALTARDANALALLDLFDFSQPALLDPPLLPQALLEPDRGCP
jgi:phospholipase C